MIIGEPRDAVGAAAIAARLGLESTGVTFPVTKRDDKVREPATEPSPILVGRTNALVSQLVKIGRARIDDLEAGDGAVQIVPRAFGNATATVVAGGDAAGADAASAYLARRVPYVWDVARGAFTLDDVSAEVARFLSARSGAGQAGLAVQEVEDPPEGDRRARPSSRLRRSCSSRSAIRRSSSTWANRCSARSRTRRSPSRARA